MSQFCFQVIDFGSSCLQSEKMFKYIQSRFYRAPEVILELEYGCAADMWSCGCILVELITGDPLFGGEDEHDQIIKVTRGEVETSVCSTLRSRWWSCWACRRCT